MLNDVAERLAELLLQYDSPLSFAFDVSDVGGNNEAALLFQLRHIMNPENLPTAVDEVLTGFHFRSVGSQETAPIFGIEEPEVDLIIDELDLSVLGRGGPLARMFRGYTPQEVAVTSRAETFDTLENRYVKHFLEECLLASQRLAMLLAARNKMSSVREAQEWAPRRSRRCWDIDIGRMSEFFASFHLALR